MGVDYAEVEKRVLTQMMNTGQSTYRIMTMPDGVTGKRPVAIFIDDIMENPCAEKTNTPST